jgi:predicted Rossmann fold nucleotide-binding protein DprA/Smf involved in DNA uptake
MPYPIIEITKTSELFPPSLRAIGEDCPERLWLRGNLELLKAEKSVAIIEVRAAQFP